ncbi:hypothetical protein BH23ACT10_BH23ACT10_34290 [soil metagenome]
MTELTSVRPVAAVRPNGRDRIRQLLRTELRLARRLHVLTATTVVTVLWSAVLAVLPDDTRRTVAPLVLLTEVTALGFLFVPALLVLERAEGVDAALRMTPTTYGERVGVRVGLTTALSLLAGAVIVISAGLPDVTPRLVGVLMLAILFGLVATTLIAGAVTLTTFLARTPLVAVPLIAPALLHLLGLVDSPLLDVSPVTSAVDLLHGRMHWAGLAWQAVWIVGCAVAVGRSESREPASPRIGTVRSSSRAPAHPGAYARSAAVRSFARTDRRTLLRDGLLLMLVVSVPLVAVLMRLVATAGVDWAQQRHGIALAAHLPLVQVVLLVLHTPVIFGSLAGLLLLEDRDAGLFGPLSVTRATIATLLGYRLTTTVAVTTITLACSLALTGVSHPAGIVGHLSTAIAAGAVSVVPALLMAALADDRVQGVAVMKMIGLPLYLPIATWFLTGSATWLFAPLPTAWVAWTAWAPTALQALAMAIGALVVTACVAAPLCRRVLRQQ